MYLLDIQKATPEETRLSPPLLQINRNSRRPRKTCEVFVDWVTAHNPPWNLGTLRKWSWSSSACFLSEVHQGNMACPRSHNSLVKERDPNSGLLSVTTVLVLLYHVSLQCMFITENPQNISVSPFIPWGFQQYQIMVYVTFNSYRIIFKMSSPERSESRLPSRTGMAPKHAQLCSCACRITVSTFRQWLIISNVTGLGTTWKRRKEGWWVLCGIMPIKTCFC